jgi:hypothetical protein
MIKIGFWANTVIKNGKSRPIYGVALAERGEHLFQIK